MGNMDNINIVNRSPIIEEYITLRDSFGWEIPDKQAIKESIKNALFSICLEKDNKLIGCGRVVGVEDYTFISRMLLSYLNINKRVMGK